MRILKTILGWIYQHFITFVIIVAVLVAGNALKREYKNYHTIVSNIEYLRVANETFPALIQDKIKQTKKRVKDLEVAADEKLKERISSIGDEISKLYMKQCEPMAWLGSYKECLVNSVGSNIQIAILEQERSYLKTLLERGSIEISKEMCRKKLVELAKTFLAAQKRLEDNQTAQRNLEINYPNKIRIPWTWPHGEYRQLKHNEPRLFNESQASLNSFKKQKQICEFIKVPGKIGDFVISNIEIDKARGPLLSKIAELEEKLSENWWSKLRQPIEVVLPTALLILVSAIFTPITIKAFLYFIVAPLASTRPSNCLMPETSGAIEGLKNTTGRRKDISDVSKEIEITGIDELVIDAEYIQITPVTGSADTKWLLDYRFPLSSLVSGMYGLTRFRADPGATYVASAMNEPLSEVAVIAIPAGSAFVLKPHCLIGIVQRIDHPVIITRHWRLGSLHAWLTLQLRYLVFHGPVSLIVTGCGGVSIEQAGQGQRINQAATIGFSANLPYATTRCETFTAYLTGKQELFNDYFPSGSGYFIYEQKPLFGKKSNFVIGRGLEGITDSVLKLFGL